MNETIFLDEVFNNGKRDFSDSNFNEIISLHKKI